MTVGPVDIPDVPLNVVACCTLFVHLFLWLQEDEEDAGVSQPCHHVSQSCGTSHILQLLSDLADLVGMPECLRVEFSLVYIHLLHSKFQHGHCLF